MFWQAWLWAPACATLQATEATLGAWLCCPQASALGSKRTSIDAEQNSSSIHFCARQLDQFFPFVRLALNVFGQVLFAAPQGVDPLS